MPEHIITLADIRAHHPCEDGWRKLITALGTSEPATRLTIGDVAKANGAADAMWCLRCIDDHRVRIAAVMPAVRRASAHTTDQRAHDCIAAIERWLAGDDSVDLRAARAAARAAGWAATEAAAEAAEAAWAAEAEEATWAAEAAAEAAEAAEAAWAAEAEEATWAAEAAAEAAEAAWAEERTRQRDDLIQMFGLLAMEGK